jgi:hypothetical protein
MSDKKVINSKSKEITPMILPSDNTIMENYIKKNKIKLTEQTLSSIEYAIQNKLPFIEVFGFKNSDFIIAIAQKDYLVNVDHIYKFYLDSEHYELCPRVVRLQSLLQNLNEKEIETNGEFKFK